MRRQVAYCAVEALVEWIACAWAVRGRDVCVREEMRCERQRCQVWIQEKPRGAERSVCREESRGVERGDQEEGSEERPEGEARRGSQEESRPVCGSHELTREYFPLMPSGL